MSQCESTCASSPLFRLPGELRNKIYHYALTIDKPVLVNSKGFHVPCLLLACHKIRSEAASIFYTRNRFDVLFEFYDSTWAVKYLRIAQKYACATDQRVTMNCMMPAIITPSWRNLVLWMCRIRYNVLPPTILYTQTSLRPSINDDPRHAFATHWDSPSFEQRISRKTAIPLMRIRQRVQELIESTRIHGPLRIGEVPTVLIDGHEQPLGQWLEGLRRELTIWDERWRFDYP